MRQDFENKMKLAQTTLSRRDSLKIARRFNAGNAFDFASSPVGTTENARQFLSSLRDSIRFASQPGVKTPGYCRSSLRDKTAARLSLGSTRAPACSGERLVRRLFDARRVEPHPGRMRSPEI